MTRLLVLGVMWAVCAVPAMAAELPGALLQPYLKAHLLLTTDSTEGLVTLAKAIETAASPLGQDAGAVVAGAKKLGGAKNLEEARAAFGDLSDALVAYSDTTHSTLPANLHVAFCPMVERPWIQTGKAIRNPYYGTEMIACGSIQK